jgi:hypothetical protein
LGGRRHLFADDRAGPDLGQAFEEEMLRSEVGFRTQRAVVLALPVTDAQEAGNDFALRDFAHQRDVASSMRLSSLSASVGCNRAVSLAHAQSVTPLDRATDAGNLLLRTAAGFSDHPHRFDQLASGIRWCRQATAGIEAAAVLEFEVSVETEEVRRANGAIGTRDALRRVVEVGKRKIELPGYALPCFRGESSGYSDGSLLMIAATPMPRVCSARASRQMRSMIALT